MRQTLFFGALDATISPARRDFPAGWPNGILFLVIQHDAKAWSSDGLHGILLECGGRATANPMTWARGCEHFAVPAYAHAMIVS